MPSHSTRALEVAEKSGDRQGVALVLSDIGVIHQSLGDNARALEYYRKSLALDEALGLKKDAALIHNRVGVVYRTQGDYRAALEQYQKALAIDESIANQTGVARELSNIGVIHLYQGNYPQALDHLGRSLKLREQLADKWGLTITLHNLGEVQERLGDYGAALDYYRRALALAESIGLKERLSAQYATIGGVLRAQGRLEEAVAHYEKALALAAESNDSADQSFALGEVARAYLSVGRYAEAAQHAERAAEISCRSEDRENLWAACTTAGRAHLALEHYDTAQKFFAEAIATIEAMRALVAGGEQSAQQFFEDKVTPYYSMAELLIARGRTGEAFAYAEQAKARVLLDVLHHGRASVTKAMTEAEQSRERELTSTMAALNSQIARLAGRQNVTPRLASLRAELQKTRLEYEAFQSALYAAHPQLKTQRGEIQPITLAEASSLLPDAASALVEFVVTERKTWLFVITRPNQADRQGVELKVYPVAVPGRELAERVERFRAAIAAKNAFKSQSRALFDLLLKPADTQLQGKTNLVIVPDGALWHLPFQALQSAPEHYLLEDAAISYAPSLTALHAIRNARRGTARQDGATLLAVGNPALSRDAAEPAGLARRDEALAPLPEAEKEVAELKRLYGGAQSRVFTGADAREDRVKQEVARYRILQFATHGVLDDAAPLYSHLVLSPGDEGCREDGLLEAWEMMKLDLNAEMVVLSACETARGRVGAGEGVIGMSWALFVAGCPTTVVSQWKVSSASTADLMLEFHRALQSGPPNAKARAMQQASLKLLKTGAYRHPFYWAGFVVVGNGN